VIDWGAGSYERTAAELAPVAQAVVDQAGLSGGDDILDLACGTGNAALLAAARGAHVVGVDGAARLLQVARDRAEQEGVTLDLREGDVGALPVDDNAVDVVISVFGVIFAPDPAGALSEIGRVLRPGGRVLLSAWVPAGPIDAMLSAMNQIIGRINPGPARPRFQWADPATLSPLAAQAGLGLESTTAAELAIRGSSPEAYVEAGQEHPLAVAARPLVEQAGIAGEIREAMTSALREGNEDPDGFLVRSPYVVHELRHN
jgi:SAM-dependent methyltransferase